MNLGEVFTDLFTTKSGDRVPSNADILPVVTIIREGVDTSVPVSVNEGAVEGEYAYSFTVPDNWDRSDEVHARIEATIEGWARRSVRRLEWTGVLNSNATESAHSEQLSNGGYLLLSRRLYIGDTSIDPVVVIGKNADGDSISANSGGWTCEQSILDEHGVLVYGPEPVTETVTVNGLEAFISRMSSAGSNSMVNNFKHQRPVRYQWLTTIKNTALDYVHSEPVLINALRKSGT